MIREAIDKIQSMCAPNIIDLNGLKYSDKKLDPVFSPSPHALKVETLTGFMDYLKANIDKLDPKNLIIQINGFNSVRLISALSENLFQRSEYITAVFNAVAVGYFGQYHDAENFVIGMQTRFVQDEVTTGILSIVGNIREESARTTADDGVTQIVTAKQGIVKDANVKVPNPVTLRPFRTFPEIEQPASLFVLRLKQGPACALFEADGGKWKQEAIINIKDWLITRLAVLEIDIPIIA